MLSFFFMTESHSIVYIYHFLLSIHLSTVCLLPCLRCCKAAAVPAWVHGFLRVWFSPHILLGVGQPDHRAALFVYINAL